MELPKEHFDDEVRDGFFVPAIMKRLWYAQLEVLKFVDMVCRKYGIKWFADCGTLLGAVRHGGYVPWDDDLDICMFREDYDLFNQVAPKELPEGYFLLNVNDEDDFEDMLTRVNNETRINYHDEHITIYHQFPYPTGLDVFVLDYLSRDEGAENFRDDVIKIVLDLNLDITDENQDTPEMVEAAQTIERLCDIKFDRSKSIKHQVHKLADRLFALFTAEESDHVAIMPYWLREKSHRFKLEYFKDTVLLPFEDIYIQAPAMYDSVLRTEYGEYMRLVHAGGEHNYPCFTKFEKVVEDELGGMLPYRYYFNAKDLEPVERNHDNVRANFKTQTSRILDSLVTINGSINSFMLQGHVQEAAQLLVSCQDVAIKLGNMIEQMMGEGTETVAGIEEYCEKLYALYEASASMDTALENVAMENTSSDTAQLLDAMNCALENVVISAQKRIIARKEIVFLPYKASLWDSFDGLWREYMDDEDCDVYVIPIPYCYKNARGGELEDCYEGDSFPQYVNITGYNDYDLAGRHPDKLYIQCPYDKCDFVMSVHPFFHTDNIIKHTDELIFVNPYIVDTPAPDDNKARIHLKHYICSPGVMHADKVIVQSEEMKQVYVDMLTEFAGKDTGKLWESKLDGSGFPRTEETAAAARERVFAAIPDDWKDKIIKPDGNCRKVIMYSNSVSAFMQNREHMLDKLNYVMDVFRQNGEDICVLWHHNPLVQVVLEKLNPELWEKYLDIIGEFYHSGMGIYDEICTDAEATILCDAYYGDVDKIVQRFSRAKKPVMIEDVEIR